MGHSLISMNEKRSIRSHHPKSRQQINQQNVQIVHFIHGDHK